MLVARKRRIKNILVLSLQKVKVDLALETNAEYYTFLNGVYSISYRFQDLCCASLSWTRCILKCLQLLVLDGNSNNSAHTIMHKTVGWRWIPHGQTENQK